MSSGNEILRDKQQRFDGRDPYYKGFYSSFQVEEKRVIYDPRPGRGHLLSTMEECKMVSMGTDHQ